MRRRSPRVARDGVLPVVPGARAVGLRPAVRYSSRALAHGRRAPLLPSRVRPRRAPDGGAARPVRRQQRRRQQQRRRPLQTARIAARRARVLLARWRPAKVRHARGRGAGRMAAAPRPHRARTAPAVPGRAPSPFSAGRRLPSVNPGAPRHLPRPCSRAAATDIVHDPAELPQAPAPSAADQILPSALHTPALHTPALHTYPPHPLATAQAAAAFHPSPPPTPAPRPPPPTHPPSPCDSAGSRGFPPTHTTPPTPPRGLRRATTRAERGHAPPCPARRFYMGRRADGRGGGGRWRRGRQCGFRCGRGRRGPA